MKKKLFLIINILIFIISSKTNANSYNDIENHWAREDIEICIENNIIDGYEDKTFKPNNQMTIAEYLKVIVTSGKFKLVKVGENLWPDYYISTAKEHGLIYEGEFNDFNKKITRNEIALITSRYIDTKDVKTSQNIFKDLNKEYKNEILKLVNLKVINGYEDNTFRGEKEITRAEAIVIANRATKERRKLIDKRNYNIEEEVDLTNINENGDEIGIHSKTRYEIEDGDILIYDKGKYASLQGYKIQDKNININNVIKVIKALVDEDSYTGVFYIPVDGIINQLVLVNGDNENCVHYGNVNFKLIYYEDKPYELRRISGKQEFSEECYMKIEITRLWNNISDYNRGIYVDEYKKNKLAKCLEIEFGKKYADDILNYMIEKNVERVSRKNSEEEQIEQKIFGKYVVNYYKKEGDIPKFYIALKE